MGKIVVISEPAVDAILKAPGFLKHFPQFTALSTIKRPVNQAVKKCRGCKGDAVALSKVRGFVSILMSLDETTRNRLKKAGNVDRFQFHKFNRISRKHEVADI